MLCWRVGIATAARRGFQPWFGWLAGGLQVAGGVTFAKIQHCSHYRPKPLCPILSQLHTIQYPCPMAFTSSHPVQIQYPKPSSPLFSSSSSPPPSRTTSRNSGFQNRPRVSPSTNSTLNPAPNSCWYLARRVNHPPLWIATLSLKPPLHARSIFSTGPRKMASASEIISSSQSFPGGELSQHWNETYKLRRCGNVLGIEPHRTCKGESPGAG